MAESETDPGEIRAAGHSFPVRVVPGARTEAVTVDIIDRYVPVPEGGDREGSQTLHIGTDVIVNGQPVYTPQGAQVRVETCDHDATKVTITFFARRVRIGHADELLTP